MEIYSHILNKKPGSVFFVTIMSREFNERIVAMSTKFGGNLIANFYVYTENDVPRLATSYDALNMMNIIRRDLGKHKTIEKYEDVLNVLDVEAKRLNAQQVNFLSPLLAV